MYCEDSFADDVEHIRPKDLYPEAVFVWENYLYACGPCNGGKRNKYAILVPPLQVIDVTRPSKGPVVPPTVGKPLFINPRIESGLVLMQLDLAKSFWFVPMAAPDTEEHTRAEFTIRILGLNAREYLVDARRNAYGSYVARLDQYVRLLSSGESPRRLAQLRKGILEMGHPTVWAEMKRQYRRIRRLRKLFEEVPQALTW